MGYFGKKWPNFDHFLAILGVEKFSTEKIFGGHLSHMETQLHVKNKKKISNGQGCTSRTDARTLPRTHESEFMDAFFLIFQKCNVFLKFLVFHHFIAL